MADEIIDDNFINIEDDYGEYVQFLRLLFTEYIELVEKIDKIIDENVFSGYTYMELTGLIRYASKRVFPLLLAFFGQDENFEDEIYPEFMEIQLMVLYLFDKLQYELDETVIKWNMNDAVIDEDIINLQSVNYLLKLIIAQLALFGNVFDIKIQNIEGTLSNDDYEKRLVEVHDDMFI